MSRKAPVIPANDPVFTPPNGTARALDIKIAELGLSVRDYGAVGDGATDDTAAFNAAMAQSSIVGVPPGRYMVSSSLTLPGGVSLIGPSRGLVTIAAAGGNTFANGLLAGTGLSDFTVSGITLDYSLAANAGSSAVINLQNCRDYFIDRSAILGDFWFGIAHDGGDNLRIRDTIIMRINPAPTQNEGILVSTAAGTCSNAVIEANTLTNTGMDLSLIDGTVSHNSVKNWQFGGGITIEVGSTGVRLIGNFCSGGNGTDVNQTRCLGIECWSDRAVIVANTCEFNDGDGCDVGGKFSVVAANTFRNNGLSGLVFRYASDALNGSYGSATGNAMFDDRSPAKQQYGCARQSPLVVGITGLDQNTYSGNVTAATD